MDNESTATPAIFNGHHDETGFTGQSVVSFRSAAMQAGRNESALASMGTEPASYRPSDMPTSKEFLIAQNRQRVEAETSVYYDHETNCTRISGGIHSDYQPDEFLKAHGFRAVNGKGEEVALTPRQSRGLIGRYIDSLNRGGGESVSFTDESLPPGRATVYLRSRW
ncbi:MAG: hypothetical protein EPN34_06130 [Burkholderiaceae bacterium]|nr:MAG: hypothetical protein EPN34_06130 [Burkholderiaceae bacterium]